MGITEMENNGGKIRIAMISIVSDPLAPVGGRQSGGASIYIYELARMLSKKGISVDIFTRWDNRKAAPTVRIAQRCRLIRLKAGSRHFIPQENLDAVTPEFLEHFLSFMRENKLKYNLIHSHQYISGRIGLQLKEILRLPLVHTFHSLGKTKEQSPIGTKIPMERFEVEKMIMQKSNQTVATSPKEKLMVVKFYGVSGDNVNIIPTGFNLKRFSKLDKKTVRKKLNIPADEYVILFAARMDENKGGLTLLEAVKWIRIHHGEIYNKLTVLMFTGDPRKTRRNESVEAHFRKKLNNEIVEDKLSERIKLHPAVDQQKLHLYYAASDLVLMPSYYEGLPLVSIEAMAMGVPVVASNVGGLQWVVQEGITGMHAKVGNGKDFGRKIVYLLKNPKVRERMGENSSILARQSFSWDIISDQMIKIYRSLLKL